MTSNITRSYLTYQKTLLDFLGITQKHSTEKTMIIASKGVIVKRKKGNTETKTARNQKSTVTSHNYLL